MGYNPNIPYLQAGYSPFTDHLYTNFLGHPSGMILEVVVGWHVVLPIFLPYVVGGLVLVYRRDNAYKWAWYLGWNGRLVFKGHRFARMRKVNYRWWQLQTIFFSEFSPRKIPGEKWFNLTCYNILSKWVGNKTHQLKMRVRSKMHPGTGIGTGTWLLDASTFCVLRWEGPKVPKNIHGCFPKIVGLKNPQIIHFNKVFPSILGYPYFWKHPNHITSLQTFSASLTPKFDETRRGPTCC